MTTSSRRCGFVGCLLAVPEDFKKEGLCLEHYLEVAFRKLAAASEQLHHGQEADNQAINWLLAQVDFAAVLLTEDTPVWDMDQRSKLLELVLGIANLNEYIRHDSVLAGRTPRYKR